jgi:hypothetical protein
MQAIMMIRIHAMYGRSKNMLIFLIIVLLASTITTGVMVLFAGIGVLGGKLSAVDMRLEHTRLTWANIRGIRLSRHQSVCYCLC